jgi:hypothetical protein
MGKLIHNSWVQARFLCEIKLRHISNFASFFILDKRFWYRNENPPTMLTLLAASVFTDCVQILIESLGVFAPNCMQFGSVQYKSIIESR